MKKDYEAYNAFIICQSRIRNPFCIESDRSGGNGLLDYITDMNYGRYDKGSGFDGYSRGKGFGFNHVDNSYPINQITINLEDL